jgi:hypothetical protein
LSMEVVSILRTLAPKELVIIAGGPAFFINHTKTKQVPGMFGHPCFKKPERQDRLDLWLMNMDAIVIGEGEKPVLEICDRVQQGRSLAGVLDTTRVHCPRQYDHVVDSPNISDRSMMPFPTFEEFELERYNRPVLPVLMSRGCINQCTCCAERHWWSGFRTRRAEHVFDEIKHHTRSSSFTQFQFCDMAINSDIEQLKKLCALIIDDELEVHWGGNANVRKEMDLSLFLQMKRAGVSWLHFGVESGSPRVLRNIGKKFDPDTAAQNLADSHQAGIINYVNLIIGFPGETKEDFLMTVAFIKQNHKNIDKIEVMDTCLLYYHSDIVKHPERHNIPSREVELLDDAFARLDWSDGNSNTYTERKRRLWYMRRQMARIGLPGPMSPERTQYMREVISKLSHHHVILSIVKLITDVDPVLDAPLVEVLVELLDHEEPGVRAGASRLLGMLEADEATNSLHGKLEDADPRVAGEVAQALGRIASPASIPHLRSLLEAEAFSTLSAPMKHNLTRLHCMYVAEKEEQALVEKEGTRLAE